jgi:uncharacterized protein YfiM (DUF2279 family)
LVITCAALSLLLFALAVLLVSREPSVPAQEPTTAQTIQAARDAIQQLDEPLSASGRGSEARLDNRMLHGVAALASDLAGARTDARVSAGILTVRASFPLPVGWWLNISATVSGKHRGFPDLKLRAGRIALPLAAGKWGAEVGRWIAQAKGLRLPPLDEMVTELRVEQEVLIAAIRLPKKGGMFDALIAAGGTGTNNRLVSEIYCHLVASQRAEPVTQLPLLVRRAFSAAPRRQAEAYNQAAFVALALYVVGNRAYPLAPSTVQEIKSCGRATFPILLRDRTDLAKHWTFSAALQAVLGNNPATAFGEWKELADSLPSGSGFSFIDLAADRSGLRIARLGVDQRSAGETAERLAAATEEDLLPAQLLRGEEGLPEAAFVHRFGTIEAENYREAVAWIDRELSHSQLEAMR